MTDDGSKVALSAFELELVANCSWLYAKRAILDKTALVLGRVANSIRPTYDALRAEPGASEPWLSPKLSRGEAYESLPWLMLDFPREFRGTDWLAIRHFFGWGQGFTVSLLLRGRYLKHAIAHMNTHLPAWQSEGWAMIVSGDPWQHGWKPASQRLLQELAPKDVLALVQQLGFLQIRKHLPVQNWAGAEDFMRDMHRAFQPLIEAVINSPAGETGP